MELLEKLIQLAKWTSVWMLVQVVPALKTRESVVETVTSQFAWWFPSGPQAGEKLVVLMATALTAWLAGPKLPP
jgi:hypothetical protein